MFIHPPVARSRSLFKAVTWRVVGSLDTFALSFIMPMVFGLPMGKSAKVALSIASVESVTKILLFYFHERAWARVRWGRADTVVQETASEPADHAAT
jgi:uncharacterized membrane protein